MLSSLFPPFPRPSFSLFFSTLSERKFRSFPAERLFPPFFLLSFSFPLSFDRPKICTKFHYNSISSYSLDYNTTNLHSIYMPGPFIPFRKGIPISKSKRIFQLMALCVLPFLPCENIRVHIKVRSREWEKSNITNNEIFNQTLNLHKNIATYVRSFYLFYFLFFMRTTQR